MEKGKVCKQCNLWKTYDNFHSAKANKDGINNRCKECIREYTKQHYQKNKDRIKKRVKKYNDENTEWLKEYRGLYYQKNIIKYKLLNKQYREENEEKMKQYKKDYQLRNQSKISERTTKWRKENKDKVKYWNLKYLQTEKGRNNAYKVAAKRRADKNNVKFGYFERKQLLDRDNWTCQNCGCKVHDRHSGNWNTPDKAHIDHIIPISKGGNSEPSNLQVLCRTCNLSKSDKVLV